MKKKMAIAGITLATMLICSNIYAEDTLQYGQETEVQTDSGSYKVTVDKIVETDQFNNDGQSAKVVCVDCVIENVDYKNYDNLLSAYNIGTGELALLDSEGISAEFYDVATTSEDGYEFSAHIKPGEKKRVALPFLVPEDTEKVTVKIDSKYTIDKSFSEESNDTSTVEDNSDIENSDSDIEERLSTLEENTKELEKKNEELESQYNDLKDENTKLKKQNKKLKKQVKELQASQSEANPETETQEESTSATEPELTEAPAENTQLVTEYKDATTIRIVQQALNEAGYNCGTPDGLAGGKTTEAITSYQTAKGITVNGLVTDELLQSLDIVEKVQEASKPLNGEEGVKTIFLRLSKYDGVQVSDPVKQSGALGYVVWFKNGRYSCIVNPDNNGKISIFIAPQEECKDDIDSSEVVDIMAYMAQAFDSTLSSEEAYSVILDTISNESYNRNGYEYTYYDSLIGMTITN